MPAAEGMEGSHSEMSISVPLFLMLVTVAYVEKCYNFTEKLSQHGGNTVLKN